MPARNAVQIALIYPDGEQHQIKSTLSTFSIGSGDACDLVIADAALARIHLYISIGDDSVQITPYAFEADAEHSPLAEGNIESTADSVERIGDNYAWPFNKPYRFGDYTLLFTQEVQEEKSSQRKLSLEQVFQSMLGSSFSFRLLRIFGVPANMLMVARWPMLILFASGLSLGVLFMYANGRFSSPSVAQGPTVEAVPPTVAPPTMTAVATETPTVLPTKVSVQPTPSFEPPPTTVTRTGKLRDGPDVTLANTPTVSPTLSFAEETAAAPTATIGPTPTPEAREVNATVEALGIWVEAAQVDAGELYWHLIDVQWLDLETSGGRHHLFIEVVDENGQRVLEQPVTVSWPDGQTTANTHKIAPDPYAYEFPMGAAGNSYDVKLQGLPSDVLHGAGLGTLEHREQKLLTSYILIYQRRQKS